MGSPNSPLRLGLVALGAALLFSCATHNKPLRINVAEKDGRILPLAVQGPPSKSCYIVSNKEEREFSCSFVEFDERGDFLHFKQHQHCWRSIRALCRKQRTLTVIYCHGWKHNAQSRDVVSFNSFLGRLANSKPVVQAGIRVHGVYLSWKGGLFRAAPTDDEFRQSAGEYFSQNITESSQRNPAKPLTWLPDQFTYWNRKRAAEDRVSGVPLSRAVFSYASVAEKTQASSRDNITVLMGHSFGALMIEQSVAEASVGALVTGWNWFSNKSENSIRNSLPFDLVLLVNSAAPSLYSKMLRDLADAHDSAADTERPLFVSLTSKADAGTGFMHPLANIFSPLDPSMKNRSYRYQMLSTHKRDSQDRVIYRNGRPVRKKGPVSPAVRQNEFYRVTPGHNDFLISHRMVKDTQITAKRPGESWNEAFENNILSSSSSFITTNRKGGEAVGWRIQDVGEEISHGDRLHAPHPSAYWIIRCDKNLINGHNDVWNDRAMQAYGAIFGRVRALK